MTSTSLSKGRLKEITANFKTLNVGVIGDFAVDAYWHIDMRQATLSREAPLFNRPIDEEHYSLGAAANVANNMIALGANQVFAITVIGEDWRGKILREELLKNGIILSRTISSDNYTTLMYAKVLLHSDEISQEDSRLDFINCYPLTDRDEKLLVKQLEDLLPTLDVLVVADYQSPGVISKSTRDWLNKAAIDHPKKIFCVDSRDHIENYKNMITKPNLLEAQRAVDHLCPSVKESLDLDQIASILYDNSNKPVYITMGEEGSYIFYQGKLSHVPAVKVLPPIDPVGAGDTYISSLSLSLAAGAKPLEAGQIATYAASVIMKKLHTTGTANINEILGCL